MAVRDVLKINALFSALSGLILIFAGGPLGRLFDVPRTLLVAVGATLLIYAADLAITAVRRGLRRFEVLLFASADAAWVLGTSGVLLVAPEVISLAGRLVLAAVAVPVATFAALQFRAARALRTRTGTALISDGAR